MRSILNPSELKKIKVAGKRFLVILCKPKRIHSFFFIRTSNFDAEAERSYIFWRFEAETFLKMFLNLPDKLVGSKVTALYENGWFTGTIEYYNAKLKEYKVNYLDNTSDFVSPDDFDGVEVILEQL